MRVLGVLPQYVPDSRVGSWVTTHDFLAALAVRGHTVDVVTMYGLTRPTYDYEGVHVHPNGTAVPRPDVVVSHLGDDGYGAHTAQRLNVPSVRMVHGYGQHNRLRLEQFPPDLAVFASHALADDVDWDGPTLVAHPPIWQARYQVTPGDCVTLSNLSHAKGGLVLAWVADALPDRPFLGVLGWGRQMEQQPPNVTVVDWVLDVRDVYRQTRVLLMPSVRETFGRVAVEAACSGIPTIAHPSPGLVEAMGDAATWVDRTDRHGWVRAVAALDDPDAWQAASDRARRAIPVDPVGTVEEVCNAVEGTVEARCVS